MAKKSGENELLTSATIANELGIHKTTVNRIAEAHGIGKKLPSNHRVFCRADIGKIKKHCYFSKGNPNLRKKSENSV